MSGLTGYTSEEIASVCHEANRRLQVLNGEHPVNPPWNELDDEMKNSAVDGVDNILINNATPEESHENWMEFKEDHGWVYGEVKDPEKKTHPCMVPYSQLPADQRVKDTLFHSIVWSLADLEE